MLAGKPSYQSPTSQSLPRHAVNKPISNRREQHKRPGLAPRPPVLLHPNTRSLRHLLNLIPQQKYNMSTLLELKTEEEWNQHSASVPPTTLQIIYFKAEWAAPVSICSSHSHRLADAPPHHTNGVALSRSCEHMLTYFSVSK